MLIHGYPISNILLQALCLLGEDYGTGKATIRNVTDCHSIHQGTNLRVRRGYCEVGDSWQGSWMAFHWRHTLWGKRWGNYLCCWCLLPNLCTRQINFHYRGICGKTAEWTVLNNKQGRKEVVHLRMHSTHLLLCGYTGHVVKDHW